MPHLSEIYSIFNISPKIIFAILIQLSRLPTDTADTSAHFKGRASWTTNQETQATLFGPISRSMHLENLSRTINTFTARFAKSHVNAMELYF